MVSPAIVLVYPTLLSLISNLNQTIFTGNNGTSLPFVDIDTTEPESMTQAEIDELAESSLNTKFILYTRNNPQVGQEIFIDDLDSVKNSFWNPDHPTRLVTHGWLGNTEPESATNLIRDAYLSIGDYNVILIDWRDAAKYLWYWKVVRSVPLVAERVASLIDFLEKDAGLDPARTRLTGHSLGGHIVGLAARFANSEIAEVIALDPAKPSFDTKEPGERVDKTDANIVQVIHTNADLLGLGFDIGDADFYPNGGTSQPGCNWLALDCAHSRSYEYYAESIKNPTGFRAGDVFMGGPFLDPNAKGRYILETASEAPFALG